MIAFSVDLVGTAVDDDASAVGETDADGREDDNSGEEVAGEDDERDSDDTVGEF